MALKIKFIILIMALLMLLPMAAAECTESWQCLDWSKCSEGMTERGCFDLNYCSEPAPSYPAPIESANCTDIFPLCFDKVLNWDETDIDCGGNICEKCGAGKSCFSNSDCSIGECTNGICFVSVIAPAPAVLAPFDFSIVLRVIAYVVVAIAIIAAIFAIIILMKRLKKRKTVILTVKKENVKETISKIIPVKQMAKKSKITKFAENFNGYLRSIKPEPKPAKRENLGDRATSSLGNRATSSLYQKDLLKENTSQNQSSVRKFMLSNIREAYNE